MASELKVAPGLLIATQQLADSNFANCVVLMVEHQKEGSFGLVLNKPSDADIATLLRGIDIDWQGHPQDVALAGGPVQPNTGWILHGGISDLESPGTHEIVPGLFLSSAPQTLKRLAAEPPERLLFVLGYAGWGPSQLESEMSECAWLNSDVTADFIFETPAISMWKAALDRLGLDLGSLAPAHGVH